MKALEALKSADDQYISDQVSMYENVDLSEASSKEVSSYKTILKEIQSLTKEKTRNYKSIQKTFAKMDQAIYLYIDSKNPLDVTVQQVDASAFPKIRLYLSAVSYTHLDVYKRQGSWKPLAYGDKKTLNYWWGLSAGVIELICSERVAGGVKRMAECFAQFIADGSFHPFEGELCDQNGEIHGTAGEILDVEELVTMDWLYRCV